MAWLYREKEAKRLLIIEDGSVPCRQRLERGPHAPRAF
jgi:hypothetical protein